MYYHHSHQLRNFTISFILNVAGRFARPPGPATALLYQK